jgi:hypothetical protein
MSSGDRANRYWRSDHCAAFWLVVAVESRNSGDPMTAVDIIRAMHQMPDSEVQETAIKAIWYWVYRLNGKIKRLDDNGDLTH